jgi:NAD(P)H-quinone oxidoreductase subunit 5
MSEHERPTVGELPTPTNEDSRLARTLTRLVWGLWLASIAALVAAVRGVGPVELGGIVAVDGLTVVLWATVTFFSGVVHSYARRYMAGSRGRDRFLGRVFAFTLAVGVLVAADHLALFATAWLAMGLLMADLVGHVKGWPQAQAAATVARRYFLASTALLAAALAALWWATGATTVSGVASSLGDAPSTAVVAAAVALVLAAMVQSALVPFHTWLLSSMTAPTPASALMHAGFVNAGGVLLVRFAPVVTAEAGVVLAVVLVGATSAVVGKLAKTVQADAKGTLACSTTGQMGFMIMQAGLGFFGAAITHLILHGFYKAYQFLAAGSRVAHEPPGPKGDASAGLPGTAVAIATGLAGGALFALLTGKGTGLDGGLVLAGLVALTVTHAAREVVGHAGLPAGVRYAAVPAVTVPAVAVYALVYRAVAGLLADLPAVGQPAELTVVHGVVVVAFAAAYLAVDTGVYRHSERLYVTLLNATQPPADTLLTSTEEYNEY